MHIRIKKKKGDARGTHNHERSNKDLSGGTRKQREREKIVEGFRGGRRGLNSESTLSERAL